MFAKVNYFIYTASILLAAGVWLQGENSPLNQKPQPDVKMLDFPISIELVPNEEKNFKVIVYNEGKSSVEQCTIDIVAGHSLTGTSSWGPLRYSSETFGVEPNSKYTATMRLLWTGSKSEKDYYKISAEVKCANDTSVYYDSSISLIQK